MILALLPYVLPFPGVDNEVGPVSGPDIGYETGHTMSGIEETTGSTGTRWDRVRRST